MSLTWNSYPNVPFIGVLPCGITNYGGDTQVFTIDPDEIGAATYPILQLNPIATAMLNQRTMAQMPQYNVPSQQQIDDEANKIATSIVNDINTNMLKQSLNVSTQNLAAQKTRLNALLANTDLAEADKTEVNRLLNKIQEEETKINELNNKMKDMDSAEALKEAQEIEIEIRQIQEDVKKIKTQEKQQTPSATETQGGQQNSPVADISSNQQNTPVSDTQSNPQSKQTHGKITEEHRQLADLFHDAITGAGTDDETFNTVCEYLNKDNIVEVMAAYEETYGSSFMNDFMGDADSGFLCAGGQKVKYGRHIARALRARAIESGVFNECKEDLQTINKEMDSTLYVSNDIYENYDNIAAVIAVKDNVA